jgi:hypothetical protein
MHGRKRDSTTPRTVDERRIMPSDMCRVQPKTRTQLTGARNPKLCWDALLRKRGALVSLYVCRKHVYVFCARRLGAVPWWQRRRACHLPLASLLQAHLHCLHLC